MRLAAAALLLASHASAAETRSLGGQASPAAVPAGAPRALPPGPTSLPPLLIGNLAEPFNPVRASLEEHAGRLRGLSQGAGLTPGQAAAYLAPLASPAAHPTERLAAGVLARAAVSRQEREALLERHPALAGGEVERLEGLVQPDGAYRGTLEDPASPLFQLAEARRDDPAVRLVFDGGPSPAGPALEGLTQEGKSLLFQARRLKPLERGQDSPLYPHPFIPGVVLRVQTDDRPAGLFREADLVRTLAAVGAGPRLLAEGTVPRAGKGERRASAVSVMEGVLGESLWDLIAHARLKTDEHRAVRELFERLAESGLEPEVMEKANILVGSTAADPRLRGFLIEPGGFRPQAEGAGPQELLRRLEGRETFDRMEVVHGGDSALPDPVYKPMGDILREGLYWGTKDPFWKSWGRALKGLFVRTKP